MNQNNIEDMKISQTEEGNTEKRLREHNIKNSIDEASKIERERIEDLYFKFKSTEERDQAIKIINRKRDERHDFDDNFRFFLRCVPTPGNPLQLEIELSKNNKAAHEYFHKLLMENNLTPLAEYETADGEPIPDHTVINGK
jgi:hypothetical protein